MSKGKFEAGRKKPASGKKQPFAENDKTTFAEKMKGKLWPILASVAGVAVVAVGVLLITSGSLGIGNSTPGTTEPQGPTRAEVEAEALKADTTLRQNNLVLTLAQELEPGEQTEDPILVTVTPRVSGAGIDMNKLRADLDTDVGKVGTDAYQIDLQDYLQLNEEALRKQAEEVAEQYNSEFTETLVARGDQVPAEDPETSEPSEAAEPTGTANASEPTESSPETTEGKSEEEKPKTKGGKRSVYIRKGVIGRSISADEVFEAMRGAYLAVLTGENEDGKPLAPELNYVLEKPQPIDVDAIYDEYCTEPKDAKMDEKTFEITDEKNGYSFDKEEVLKQVEELGEGEELLIKLKKVKPKVTAKKLRATLFRDVLAEAHTIHSAIPDRTNNLILACKAIDGTIILPGQTFSFNKVVGERTPEKGYKPAIAYVGGGASKAETGGGVCQVASSIYYAVLQADLKTIERAPHMYLVDYVPGGMDAAIYWGQLDYKFENNSPYPLRIDASVSNGKVHIVIMGTEWKDYRVEMSYKVLETTPWEVVKQEVENDGTHYEGEVLTTPYTGYKIAVYKTTYDLKGKKLDSVRLGTSSYNKRDKVIAVFKPKPTEPKPTEPKPTEPKPTEPKPTEPKPTEPKPTEEPTEEPTEPEGDD